MLLYKLSCPYTYCNTYRTPDGTLKKSKSLTKVSTPSVDGNETTDIPVKVMSSGIMKGPSSKSSSRRASIIDISIEAQKKEPHAFEGNCIHVLSRVLCKPIVYIAYVTLKNCTSLQEKE